MGTADKIRRSCIQYQCTYFNMLLMWTTDSQLIGVCNLHRNPTHLNTVTVERRLRGFCLFVVLDLLRDQIISSNTGL
jgi:hypothetical protein